MRLLFNGIAVWLYRFFADSGNEVGKEGVCLIIVCGVLCVYRHELTFSFFAQSFNRANPATPPFDIKSRTTSGRINPVDCGRCKTVRARRPSSSVYLFCIAHRTHRLDGSVAPAACTDSMRARRHYHQCIYFVLHIEHSAWMEVLRRQRAQTMGCW